MFYKTVQIQMVTWRLVSYNSNNFNAGFILQYKNASVENLSLREPQR